MSLNLAFESVHDRKMINFPVQCSTELTLVVMRAGSTDERIRLIEQEIRQYNWAESYIQQRLNEIRRMLADRSLKLIMI